MDAGATFLLADSKVDSHLWIVLSDPEIDAEEVLLVSLTTVTALKEKACLLNVGDHAWVRHPTCVAYDKSKAVSLETLYKLKAAGHLSLRDPLSPQLLKRIRDGAANSERMPLRMAEILSRQGLIEI